MSPTAPAGTRPLRQRPAARVLALLVVVLWSGGCADTIRPVPGGLQLGANSGPLQLPVLQNDHLPFEYPREAWRKGVGGETVLKLHIDRRGRVDSVFVLRSSGDRSLDSAALVGARRLEYRPARQGEQTVDIWATLPIRYPMPEAADGKEIQP